MATTPDVATLKVGQTSSVGGVTLKLMRVTPYPSDPTPGQVKAAVTLEVGGQDEVTVGEYARNAVVWGQSLVALASSTLKTATVRVTPFSFTCDTSELEPLAAPRPLELGRAFTVKDLKVTVKSLAHVSEYGSYWVMPVEVEHHGQTFSFNQGSFNYLGFMFSLVPNGLEGAQLVVRHLRAGEPFVLGEGDSLEVQVNGHLVELELMKVTQNEKAHRLEYDFRIGPDHQTVQLGLPFVEQFEQPPPGKTIDRLFSWDFAAAKVLTHGLSLEKVKGSAEPEALRRGPFRLTVPTEGHR